MREIKVELLTADFIAEIQASAAGDTFQGEVPTYRVGESVPEQLRLTAEVDGGVIIAFADVFGVIEDGTIIYHHPQSKGGPETLPKVETFWRIMCQVPDLLGKVLVDGLYIGKTVRLPVNGVWLKFDIALQHPKP